MSLALFLALAAPPPAPEPATSERKPAPEPDPARFRYIETPVWPAPAPDLSGWGLPRTDRRSRRDPHGRAERRDYVNRSQRVRS